MSHSDNDYQTFNHGTPAGHSEGTSRAPQVQVYGGGVTRVAHGIPAEQAPQAPRESFKVHNGPIRYSSMLDSIEEGYAQHIYSDAGTAGSGIMQTLRTTGSRPSVELIPGDPTSRTELRTAERMGLIENRDGRYQDARPTTPAQAVQGEAAPTQADLDAAIEAEKEGPEAQQRAADADLLAAAIDHEEEEYWAEDIGPLSQPGFDRATASAINLVANGHGTVDNIALALARDEGMDPARATEYVTEGMAMGQRIVDRAMAKLGFTGERLQALYADMRNQPGRLQEAIQKVAHGRDFSGFRTLAVEHKVRHTDLSTFRAAGWQAATDPTTGEVLLQRGVGPWVKASALK